jgi:adenine-specific DNA-methyltransferase
MPSTNVLRKLFGEIKLKNLIIESDNLIAMQNLLPMYEGKIDVMPIDPPYNTEIDYIEYKDGNYDNGWVNFMQERLEVAYKLLSKNGVMFIHIDENELLSLTMLCGKIFGAKNILTMVWKKANKRFDQNRKEKPLESGIRRTHEYVLLCFKDRANTTLNPIKQPVWNGKEYVEKEKTLETVIDDLGTTSSAKDELAYILGDRAIFSTPKPVKLIKEFVRAGSNKKSIILDFFAGSGTTGHAVMDLNKEDDGERKFILITNNESNICQKVTIPRIQKAIEKFGFNEEIEIR